MAGTSNSTSRIPQFGSSKLMPPGTLARPNKRSMSPNATPSLPSLDSKRARLDLDESRDLVTDMMPPLAVPASSVKKIQANTRAAMQRSMSVVNLGAATSTASFVSGNTFNFVKGVGNKVFTGRASHVPLSNRSSAAVTSGHVSNISGKTDRITTARSASQAGRQNGGPPLRKTSSNGSLPPSAGKGIQKTKPAWDLRGQMEDMKAEQARMSARLQLVEQEKNGLAEMNVRYVGDSNERQQEVETLRVQLSQCQQELEKTTGEHRISELRTSQAEADLAISRAEALGLKASVAQMANTFSITTAELEANRLQLNEVKISFEKLMSEHEQTLEMFANSEKKLSQADLVLRQQRNTILELKGNIRVFCRLRPLLDSEEKAGVTKAAIVCVDEKTLVFGQDGGKDHAGASRVITKHEFKYDRVFSDAASQAEIFEELCQLVQSALEGYNVCVFAYGQTGSGKTHTMEGKIGDTEMEGVIPRSIHLIFTYISEMESKGWQFTVEASFLEVYNERIHDLLENAKVMEKNVKANGDHYDVKLVGGRGMETYVTNLKVEVVRSFEELYRLLFLANKNRATSATKMNEQSSRSHSVFKLKLTGTNTRTGESSDGTLNLVDLAGSERLKDSLAEGDQLRETKNINKSLSHLGAVMMMLAQKNKHIRYRDSKLTFLLQNCLGGNSKTLMFVNVSPTEAVSNESMNSLRFGAQVNEINIGTAIKQLRK